MVAQSFSYHQKPSKSNREIQQHILCHFSTWSHNSSRHTILIMIRSEVQIRVSVKNPKPACSILWFAIKTQIEMMLRTILKNFHDLAQWRMFIASYVTAYYYLEGVNVLLHVNCVISWVWSCRYLFCVHLLVKQKISQYHNIKKKIM